VVGDEDLRLAEKDGRKDAEDVVLKMGISSTLAVSGDNECSLYSAGERDEVGWTRVLSSVSSAEEGC
jgi:hypothetical protein